MILSIDIETVAKKKYSELSERELSIWRSRTKNRFKECEISEIAENNFCNKYENNAGFYPEFSEVVCISIYAKDVCRSFTCIDGVDNELQILKYFAEAIAELKPTHLLGHNIKTFDIPYLIHKYMQHQISCPAIFKKGFGILNKNMITTPKPWELDIYIDTMQLFRSLSSEYYSLDAICLLLNIPTPKKQMSGSQVAENYPHNIAKIAKYCEADCKAVAAIYINFINFLKQ